VISERTGRRLTLAALAFVAYVPLVLTQPGWVGADTKHYLYLDPWRLMTRAASVWDPSIGLGTVSHQNIGYLWPMGPWYAFFDLLGAPDWFAQRLWLATTFFAAGAGVVFLLRHLGLVGAGAFVAAFAYQLSPYVLTYAARITAILLPWAGLPWLLLFTVLALRRGGWRWPAAIALLVTTIGSINASSLLYAALAAALWVPYAVVLLREVSWGDGLRTIGRIGALTVVTQVWWLIALVLSGSYGPPVLKTTETLAAVSASSVTTEIVRSLGNWFFYGRDAVGPWVEAAVDYQTEGWLIAATFALPVAALAGAAITRWAHRAYFLVLIVVGAAIAVAAHPYDDPSPLGAVTKLAADSSTFALALRNAQRATPLLVLGMAVMLGAGVTALGRRFERADVLAAVAATATVAITLPALWSGALVDPNLRRPEDIPEWNIEAARALDQGEPRNRVLEIPGTDFAAFRWGNTIDPLLPGLIDRPWVSRESAPQGTPGTISLVTALDRRVQEGLLETEALARVARLVSAGDLVVRGDLQTERYRTPRPRVLADLVTPTPPGLSGPATFGPAGQNVPPPSLPLVDEITLGLPSDTPDLAALSVFGVEGAPQLVRSIGLARPALVDGDGEGLVELAAAGLLDGRELVAFGPTATSSAAARRALLRDDARLVVTDTNRRRAQRFTQLRENYGFTEQAGERPLRPDAADARMDLFPGAGDDARTVAVVSGVRSIRATAYGNTITYIPEERPFAAIDDSIDTAWRVGAFESPIGHRLRIELAEPTTLEELVLTQPVTGARNRWITKVGIRLDGGRPRQVVLDDSSRLAAGQRIPMDGTRATVVELEVLEDNVGKRPDYVGLSAVGFADVRVVTPAGLVVADEWIRPPRTLLDAAGTRSASHDLTYVFSRLRANPAEPVRADPERRMQRIVSLPTSRAFQLSGSARISARVGDDRIDALLGLPAADAGGLTARSSSRLPGSLIARASSAFDGDTSTAWIPAFNAEGEQYLEVVLPQPATIDRLDLRLVVDGRHSVPTLLQLTSGTEVRTIVVPDQPAEVPGGIAEVPVELDPITGTTFTLTIGEVATRTTTDYFSRAQLPLPVAIAEVGLPGVVRPPLPQQVPTTCRGDVLRVDDRWVPIRLAGDAAAAARGGQLSIEPCDHGQLDLAAGDHRLQTAAGVNTGIDVDRLVLDSPTNRAGGGAGAGADRELRWERTSRSSYRVTVPADRNDSWLVLAESLSPGWSAKVESGGDLGDPVLLNGFANGWLVDREVVGTGEVDIELRWTPQRAVTAGLVVSAIGALACIALLAVSHRAGPGHRVDRCLVVEAPSWGPVVQPADVASGRGTAVPTRASAAAAVACAGFAAFVASPAHGVVAAVLVAVAASVRWARALPMAVAVGAAAAGGAGTLLLQVRHGYAPGFEWASNFDRLHSIGWFVFVGVAAEIVVSMVGARTGTNRTDRDPEEPEVG
jgi:arabinofuranan 3-O-arabinosyltransferase